MSSDRIPEAQVSKLGPVPIDVCGPALLALVSGRLRVRSFATQDVIRLEERDMMVVHPGHTVELESLSVACEAFVLVIGDDWGERAVELAACEPQEQTVPLFVERAGGTTARRVERLLAELASPVEEENASARLRSVSNLLALLAIVFESRTKVLEPGARRSTSSRRIDFRTAVERLHLENLAEISLGSFARGIGLSPRQVSRLFREELGTTFREHLVEVRLARARRLLERTDESIIDVAVATGWSSLAHFNAVFRKRVGTTPSGYRACLARARASER